MRQGFTLVELAIVLVIVGLIAGGVLVGRDLIRAAELKSIVTEYDKYQAAVNSFRTQYFALPGDLNNATSFWGKDNTNCAGHTGAAATPGTCNGNRDNIINDAGGTAGVTAEAFQFWKQLALAGLIEGVYSGLNGPGGNYVDSVIGTNIPAARIAGVGWSVFYQAYSGTGTVPDMAAANHLWLGTKITGQNTYGRFINPTDAWNIDGKIDDGRPLAGKVLAMFYNTCTNAASSADMNATYLATTNTLACSLIFVGAF